MNKTIITVIIIVAVVLLGGYLLFKGTNQPQMAPQQSALEPLAQQQPSSQVPANQPPATEEKIITYTDSGFSPSTLTIKKGDTVTFKNTASDDMRVASNPHPVHNEYPTKGGCVSSTFDSCNNILPNQSWSFKFDIVGIWGYHNHLNPGEGGKIVVQ